ncbi:MAG: winged helix-turn-helix transcriptional regulator [Promethearchaeota archaeon]
MNSKKNSIGKPIFDLDNFKELIDLIPSIQEAVVLGLKRELKKPKQLKKIIKMDRNFIREVSTLLQGKWTVDILYMIFFLRKPFFNELRKSLHEINTRTLTNRLSSLEEKGIIKRTVHTGRPIRVFYEMTAFGKGLTTLFYPIAIYVILEDNKKKN